LEDASAQAPSLIRDCDATFTAASGAVLNDAGLEAVTSGARGALDELIMERRVQTCQRELLDRP